MSKLYQESITDAKALKDLAIENGRAMLSESFSEKLEEMVNALLNEGSSYDDKEEKDKKKKDDEKVDETKDYKDDGKAGTPAGSDQVGDREPAEKGKKDMKKESADVTDVDAFLESVDQELSEMRDKKDHDFKKDKKYDKDKPDMGGKEKDMEEAVDTSDIGKGDKKPSPKSSSAQTEDPGKGKFFESLSREDLMTIVMEALEEVSKDEEKPKEKEDDDDKEDMKEMKATIASLESKLSETTDKLSETESQLEEAENVINRLSSTINEANLLNSKLLHVNKLNNEFDLTEGQKEKILNKINEGENIKEVKLIYSVLQESFESSSIKKKTVVNESSNNGTASAATASTAPKKDKVNESIDSVRNRYQILAGIKQSNILED